MGSALARTLRLRRDPAELMDVLLEFRFWAGIPDPTRDGIAQPQQVRGIDHLHGAQQSAGCRGWTWSTIIRHRLRRRGRRPGTVRVGMARDQDRGNDAIRAAGTGTGPDRSARTARRRKQCRSRSERTSQRTRIDASTIRIVSTAHGGVHHQVRPPRAISGLASCGNRTSRPSQTRRPAMSAVMAELFSVAAAAVGHGGRGYRRDAARRAAGAGRPLPDEVGGVGAGHPGGRDVQRPGRGSAQHRDGVGGGAEGRLGHADHRDAELVAGAGAQAGPSVRVQVGVAVDDQQGHLGQAVQHRAQRRELAQVEPARLVGRDVRHHGDAVAGQAGKGRIGGHDGGRPGTAGGAGSARPPPRTRPAGMPASFHASRMPAGNE